MSSLPVPLSPWTNTMVCCAYEFDLVEHFLQRAAFADDLARPKRGGNFFAQVIVLLFESLFRAIRFPPKRGHWRWLPLHGRGERAQPGEILRSELAPVENSEHAQRLTAKHKRLSGETLHTLGGNPRRPCDP